MESACFWTIDREKFGSKTHQTCPNLTTRSPASRRLRFYSSRAANFRTGKGNKIKGSSTLHARCGYRRGPLIQDQRPNVAVPPVNLRGAVMGSVAQSSSQTSKTQTKKNTHNFLHKESCKFIRKYQRLAGNRDRRVTQDSWTEFRRGPKASWTAAKESRSNKDQVPSGGWIV